MSSILSHDRMKKSNFLRRFQLFRHQTESNMCLSFLWPPRLPPLKAPLTIGRPWVQFLVMTEWKNPIFLRKFQLFRLPTESNMCSSALFPSRLPPLKALLPIGRSWVQFLEWKNPIFSEDFIFSDLRTGCNEVYSCPGRVDHLRRPPCSRGGGGGETGIPHVFHR